MADAAADAFDAGVGGRRSGEAGGTTSKSRLRFAREEVALGVAPLVEERRHVDGEVLDHGEVAERLEPQLSPSAASLTRVRQVQRGRPFTTMAQEPHMPTRQAKRYDRVASCSRWICVTTSRMVWCARRGTAKVWKAPSAPPRQTSTDNDFGTCLSAMAEMLGHAVPFEHRIEHARPSASNPFAIP